MDDRNPSATKILTREAQRWLPVFRVEDVALTLRRVLEGTIFFY